MKDSNFQSLDYKSSALANFANRAFWLRELDLNQRPPGYEPSELPNCSIARHLNCLFWLREQDLNLHIPAYETGELPVLYPALPC